MLAILTRPHDHLGNLYRREGVRQETAMSTLNARELSALVTTFEQAWDEYAETHAPVSTDMYRFREILAKRILTLTREREANEPQLSAHGPSHGPYQQRSISVREGRRINELA
jgi:hypothetical protein